MEKFYKSVRKHARQAYKSGGTVPYSLRVLLEAGLSLKVIRAVVRN
jgi:hypothetical protein